MTAYITSIGEPTTDLCKWALERNGFEVKIIKNNSNLWQKLKDIYGDTDQEFLRVDADIIVNRNLTVDLIKSLKTKRPSIWWWQFLTFDWYKQDINHAMAYISEKAINDLRSNINKFENSLRPETEVSRIKEFHNPRRMETYEISIMGLHGFKGNVDRAKKLKEKRGQENLYDFELARKLNKL